jgi:hypothetical protein
MKNRVLILVLCATISILFACGKEKEEKPIETGTALQGDEGFTYKIDLGPMQCNWSVEGENLKVRLTAKTTGWVGIGFNPTDQMKDANFHIGMVEDGEVSVEDHFGHGVRQHRADIDMGGQDNCRLINGSEENGVTDITMEIPLTSDDSLDCAINPMENTTVLLSCGRSDRLVQQHIFRSKSTINLNTGSYTIHFKHLME